MLYRLKSRLLTIFGDIQVYPWPMFVIYNPKSYKMTGAKCREVLDLVQPADVLLRGYDRYLDSFFIPLGESKCSHSGLYVGGGKVIHAVAEGVKQDDILDFCRADRVCVLRPRIPAPDKALAMLTAKALLGRPYDFNFDTSDTDAGPGRKSRYFCHEFTKTCFRTIKIEKRVGKSRFLKIRSPALYLADSFYANPAFERIYNSNSRGAR